MCWSLRVYWTVLHNLFARFYNNIRDLFYNYNCYRFCGCIRCCCQNSLDFQNSNEVSESGDLVDESGTTKYQHDYVIVDDIDANYVEIERRKIETETYYRTVDRTTAEDMLSCREDGACLVRPFREMDISIKYIVSIYAQQQFYHLFIRQIDGKELYGIGQEKQNERHFKSPNDIIEFYSYNALLCTNKNTSNSLVLRPIIA